MPTLALGLCRDNENHIIYNYKFVRTDQESNPGLSS